MNIDLLALLAQCGWEPHPGMPPSQSVVMVHNIASVPPNPARGPGTELFGFHLLLLGESGKPVRYARCYPAAAAKFARECAIATRLSGDAQCRTVIPGYQSAANRDMRILVSEFLDGQEHTRVAARMFQHARNSHIDRIFQARRLLTSRASELLGDVLDSPRESATVSLATHPDLSRHIASEVLAPLVNYAQSVEPLRWTLQHCDFWSRNVILAGGQWHVIDFEDFARFNSPLYDYFHFAQSLARSSSRGDRDEWLGPQYSRRIAAVKRGLANAYECEIEASGLDEAHVDAALLTYLMDMCAFRMRAGVPASVSAPLARDIMRMSRHLISGGRPSQLLAFLA